MQKPRTRNHSIFIFLTLSFLFSFAACAPIQRDSSETMTSTERIVAPTTVAPLTTEMDALTAYDLFLQGAITARDPKNVYGSGGTVSFEELSPGYYALYDMNGDGTPELHTTTGGYALFTFIDNEVVLWYIGATYCLPLQNGAILYSRPGAHNQTYYQYTELDTEGNEVFFAEFGVYDAYEEDGVQHQNGYQGEDPGEIKRYLCLDPAPVEWMNIDTGEKETFTTAISPYGEEIIETIDLIGDESVRQTYRSVLQNESTFFHTSFNDFRTLDQAISEWENSEVESAEFAQFAIVDLDGDGIQEVILKELVNGNRYGSLILHSFEDGTVHGYSAWFRAFRYVKTNGTFDFSGSAFDGGFGKLEFKKEITEFHDIVQIIAQSHLITNIETDELRMEYFVNDKEATEEEFYDAWGQYDSMPDVLWYDLTTENIEKLF